MRSRDNVANAQLLPDVEVRLVGAIGVESLSALRHELDRALALDPEHVIVEVGHCTALAPEAIHSLLDAQASCSSRGGSLILRGVNPDLARTLALAGVIWLFPTENCADSLDLRHAG